MTTPAPTIAETLAEKPSGRHEPGYCDELLGRRVELTLTTPWSPVLLGVLLDETKNTFVVDCEQHGRAVIALKRQVVLIVPKD